jgi:hypothetical protein
MAKSGSVVTRKIVEFLSDPEAGLGPVIAEIAEASGIEMAGIGAAQIVAQHVPVELLERSRVVPYPVVQVYADRVRNVLTEKFRSFSGKVRAVVEVRVSQDRLEWLEDRLRLYVDGVTEVLDGRRGDWGEGAFFNGAYEVTFDAVKQGGRNLLQVARIALEVDLSS